MTEARRRYAQGSEFFRRERYAEAVAEFSEAYRLWQNPTILYALAQAYEGLTQARKAIDTYRRYLETAPENDPRRAEVATRIEELTGLLGTVRIESNVPAEVYINGEREDVDAPGVFQVPTGRHSIELRAAGYAPSTQSVVVAAGTARTLAFALARIEERVEVVRVESQRRRLPRPVFFCAVGATSASLVVWASLGGVALSRRSDYNADPDRNPLDRAEVRRWNRRADAMLGVTAGLGIATLIIGFMTDWDGADSEEGTPSNARPRADLSFSTGGAMLELGWTR